MCLYFNTEGFAKQCMAGVRWTTPPTYALPTCLLSTLYMSLLQMYEMTPH